MALPKIGIQEKGKDTMQDKFSFEEMYDEYFDKVNRYLRYRVRNHWDADDLTTTVFLKAFEKLDQYNHQNSFGSWIFRIAHNTYVDYLRKKREYPMGEGQDFLESQMDPTLQPEMQTLTNEMIKELNHMLHCLPDEQRDVLTLRYFGDLKIAEVADVLGKTESAVKMLSYRGIQKLRKIFGEGEPDE